MSKKPAAKTVPHKLYRILVLVDTDTRAAIDAQASAESRSRANMAGRLIREGLNARDARSAYPVYPRVEVDS